MPFPARRLALVVLVPLLSGCASIANGDRQSILLRSTPEGAEILEDGYVIGSTPTLLRFKRNQSHTLTFRKEGYQDVTVELTRVVNGAVCLNGSSWLGYALDFAGGSAYRLSPTEVTATLTEGDLAAAQATDGAVHVVFVTVDPARPGVGLRLADERPEAGTPTPAAGCSE